MNRIVRTINDKNETIYTIETESGKVGICKEWTEKKAGKADKYHVMVPADLREETGRTYISLNYFKNSDIYEFETKTEHREGLGNGGWEGRLTDDEKIELQEARDTIERLKKVGLGRKPLSEADRLKAEIEALKAQIASMKS